MPTKFNEVKGNKKVTTRGSSKKSNPTTIYVDLGNYNYKMLVGEEKTDAEGNVIDKELKETVEHCNVEEVEEGTFGAWKVDDEYYAISPNAELKKDSNKIVKEKRAMLGYVLYKKASADNKSVFRVVTLLPLSLYINAKDGNREAYAELLKGDYKVSDPNGIEKTFFVEHVEVCCESFSALVIMEPEYRKNPVYLVDLGGVDWSGVYVEGNSPNEKNRFTKPVGMNAFYNELAAAIASKVDKEGCLVRNARLYFEKYSVMTVEEAAQKGDRAKSLKEVIDEVSRAYIEKHVFKELHAIGHREDLCKVVFVGGASKSFENYIREGREDYVVISDDALFANVKGARKIAILRAKREAKSAKSARKSAKADKTAKEVV